MRGHVKDTDVLICPSSEPSASKPYSYAYNVDVALKKESEFHSPTVVVLNWERDSQPNALGDRNGCGRTQIQPWGPIALSNTNGCSFPAPNGDNIRHLDGSNFSFLDGHVKWYTPDKVRESVIDGSSPTFKAH